MRIALQLLLGLAFFTTTEEARAFCRTTTLSGDNQSCVEQGLPLFWRSACVGLHINEGGTRVGSDAEISALAQTSVHSWSLLDCASGGHPSVALDVVGTTAAKTIGFDNRKDAQNENLVLFYDTSWPHGDPKQLALTTLTFQKSDGEIVDADLEINSTRDLYLPNSLSPKGYDLETIFKHEAGHILGLAHTSVNGATMFPTYDPGSVAQRTQKDDDIDGICAIYPANGTRATAGGVITAGPCTVENETCGCASHGSASNGGVTAILGALLVLATRARRDRTTGARRDRTTQR